ncbi:hypothetical protein yrohd0001_33910 [Yersinia rohdei ATCC 43380]|nr:hypothetical protein yrohd0001_33910 [Yersinia rohdei ATCC 43380]
MKSKIEVMNKAVYATNSRAEWGSIMLVLRHFLAQSAGYK